MQQKFYTGIIIFEKYTNKTLTHYCLWYRVGVGGGIEYPSLFILLYKKDLI